MAKYEQFHLELKELGPNVVVQSYGAFDPQESSSGSVSAVEKKPSWVKPWRVVLSAGGVLALGALWATRRIVSTIPPVMEGGPAPTTETDTWVSPFAQAPLHPLQPSKLWGSLNAPFPTGAWWTNAVNIPL